MKDLFFYQINLTPNKPNLMICFYSGHNFSLESFYNEIVTQFKASVFTRNFVFITPSFNEVDITNKVLNDETQSTLKDRINSFQELNFHTCFISRSGEYNISTFNKKTSALKKDDLDRIIKYGLYNIIKNRNLIIEAHSNIHFIKPSRKHASKFIDTKNLLESSSEISFIATCVLKFLPKEINKIYVDTSGIYPLAYELSNIIRAFDNSSEIISIDSFGSYGGIDEYIFSSDEKTLVLISASTSNNLFKKLNTNSYLEQASIVSIIMTQVNDSKQKVLIEFEDYKKIDDFSKSYFSHFDSYDENKCPMCLKEHSIPIALDKSRFIFEAPRTSTYLPVAKDSDMNLRNLIHNYKDHEVFKCLFDGVDGKKQPTPEFFIDLSCIIDHDEFKNKVINNINRYFPLNTDCIVHCNDSGAKELAHLIYKIVSNLDLKVDIHEGIISKNKKPKKGIVVIAGSIESGKSLLNISRALREFNELPITYIIGFAKYNSEKEFKKLQMDLKFSEGPCGFHEVHAIERILLPINEYKEHSWNKELELFKELAEKYKDNETIKSSISDRIKQLKECSSIEKKGLGFKLLLPSADGKDLVLGKTFAFWNKGDNDNEFMHQSTVYFTISSVLQKLRTTANDKGIVPLGTGYIIRQLDPLLFDRFNEGIIQGSILRAAKARELDYSADDTNSSIIGSLIERMLKFPESDESTGLTELLLALSTKKLQVKKDYLLGLKNHSLNQDKHPMAWLLTEYSKEILLENNESQHVTF